MAKAASDRYLNNLILAISNSNNLSLGTTEDYK